MKTCIIRKLLLSIIALVICNTILISQNLLNYPESIVYDSLYKRYLVSNYMTGSIVQIDSSGNQSYFVQNMNATQGLQIVDTVVYVGCDSTLRGFHLTTGEQIMNLQVNGVANLNDVTADNENHLYVSDVFGTKIIKVYPESQSYSVFVQGNGIIWPNGVVFDEKNNRLLVCSYRLNFPIQAINLSDSMVTTLVETELDYSDGIVIDEQDNVYVTSWETNAIYKYDPLFTNPPEMIYQNYGGPADIYYDKINNLIAIPLQGSNSVDYLPIVYTGIEHWVIGNKSLEKLNLYPNPFRESLSIEYTLLNKSQVHISIIDVSGKLVLNLIDEFQEEGENMIIWMGTDQFGNPVPSGIYYCTFQDSIIKQFIKIIKTN